MFSLFGPAVPLDEPKVRGSADVVDSVTQERVAFDALFWFAVAAFRPDIRIVRG